MIFSKQIRQKSIVTGIWWNYSIFIKKAYQLIIPFKKEAITFNESRKTVKESTINIVQSYGMNVLLWWKLWTNRSSMWIALLRWMKSCTSSMSYIFSSDGVGRMPLWPLFLSSITLNIVYRIYRFGNLVYRMIQKLYKTKTKKNNLLCSVRVCMNNLADIYHTKSHFKNGAWSVWECLKSVKLKYML